RELAREILAAEVCLGEDITETTNSSLAPVREMSNEHTARYQTAQPRRCRVGGFSNPEHALRERMGRWTGAIPEELCLIDRDADGRLVFPRGAAAVVRDAVASAGRQVAFDDRRVRHEPVGFELALSLRDYQEEAVLASCATRKARRSSP